MSASISLPLPASPSLAWPYARRLLPLTLVLLLHAGFFYALQSGLLQSPLPSVPNEVLVRLISAEPARQPMPAPAPVPKPAPPKTLPVLRKPLPKPQPKPAPLPVTSPAPSERAITIPAEPQAAPEPAAASASASASALSSTSTSTATADTSIPAPPKTISSGVEYLQAPQPEYPLLARRKGEEGKVVLRALINLKGRPDQVEIQSSSGSARLDEAARQAVLRAVFKPHLEDGKPVMVYAIVPIKFQLDR